MEMMYDITSAVIAAIIAAVIAAILIFFLMPLLEDRYRKRNRIKELEKTIEIKLFFIGCHICKASLTGLLLRQNGLQQRFTFELAQWDEWDNHWGSEVTIKKFETSSKLAFCDLFRRELDKFYNETSSERGDIDVVITQKALPENYYAWNTEDKKTIVIGINNLANLLGEDEDTIKKVALRIVQRMLIYSQNIKGLKTHKGTRACLFDHTNKLMDFEHLIEGAHLCPECKKGILYDGGIKFQESMENWLKETSVYI